MSQSNQEVVSDEKEKNSEDPSPQSPVHSHKKPHLHAGAASKDWSKVQEQEEPTPSSESLAEMKEPEGQEEGEVPAVMELKELLTKEEAKSKEYQDQCLRLRAEIENVRWRASRDIGQAHKYALEGFARKLLSVVDNLERGLQACQIGKGEKALIEGVELTLKELLAILNQHGIVAIDPNGQVFDPNLHQAVSIQENDEVSSNTVLNVLQKGYQMHERVLRPAMVTVSKKAENS